MNKAYIFPKAQTRIKLSMMSGGLKSLCSFNSLFKSDFVCINTQTSVDKHIFILYTQQKVSNDQELPQSYPRNQSGKQPN